MTQAESNSASPRSDSQEPDYKAVRLAADGVRRLISQLRKTQAGSDVLEKVAASANALADELEPFEHPGPYAQRRLVIRVEDSLDRDTDVASEYFPYSPIVGPNNPIAPPVDFRFVDGEIHAEHAFDAQYNGPPTAVHGGIVALVFDELLGCAGIMNNTAGFTGTLNVRYNALTPIGVPIRMRAWVDRIEGRKIFIRGTMHDGEILTAEAEGIFIHPKQSIVEDALAKNAART